MKTQKAKFLFFLAGFVVLAIVAGGVVRVLAQTGPQNGAGSGYGAISTDIYNDVGIGTSTIPTTGGGARLLIWATSTPPAPYYSLKIVPPSGVATIFTIDNSGNVTTTGAMAANTFVGNWSGTLSAGNISSGAFGSNNGCWPTCLYAFPNNLGVGTTTQVGLPKTLSVYGGGYFYSGVGIGTSTPQGQLAVSVTYATDDLRLDLDSAGGGHWAINPFIAGVSNDGLSFIDKTGGVARMVIQQNGNVGIGTTAPVSMLSVGGTGMAATAVYASSTTGVYGIGSSYGVEGVSAGAGTAVYGYNTSNGTGVAGYSASGTAISGTNTGAAYAISGTNTGGGGGVYGSNTGGNGYGVYGSNNAAGYGVYGTNSGTGTGVYGGANGTGFGVYGTNGAINGVGVYGSNTNTNASAYGVYSNGNFGVTGTEVVSQTSTVGALSTNKICLSGTCNATWPSGNVGTVTSITAGTGLSGGTITGSGTIAVNYGSSANTAAQGNVTHTGPAAGTGLSGGGGVLAVGTTGTFNTINLNLGSANTWTATQTVPNLIDSGVLNQPCVGTSAAGQLQAGTCGATTIVAGNVSSGSFGSNTGGGNYSFPASVGIGTSTPVSTLAISVAGNPTLTINSSNSGGVTEGINFTDQNGTASITNSWWNAGGMTFTASRDLTQNGFHFYSNSGTDVMHVDTQAKGVAIGTNYALPTVAAPANGLIVAGNVGIGTTTPGATLDVNGNIRASSGYALSNDSQGTVLSTSAGTLYLDGNAGNVVVRPKNASGVFSVMNSASVGIGTTAPGSKLDVRGAITAGDGTIQNVLSYAGATYGVVGTLTNNDEQFWTNSAARMTILAAGNVGIGDTTPASLLSVGSGDLFQVNSSGNLIKINNVTYSWPSSQGGASTYLKNDGSGNLTWAAAGTGTVTSITAGTGLSGGTITGSGTISLNLAGGLPVNTWMYASGAGTRNWYIAASDMYWELGGNGYFHFRNSSDADVANISYTGVGSFAAGTTIGGSNICLANGTNCPTINAANVSAGTFGSNTGGGSYTFQGSGSGQKLVTLYNSAANADMYLQAQGGFGFWITTQTGMLQLGGSGGTEPAMGQVNISGWGGVGIATTTISNALSVQGSENISGSLGIGMASPGQKLDVAGGYIRSDTGYCIGGSCITSWPSGTVTSVFGRTGAVAAASGDYSVGQITGAAPLASPTFTGTVTAPTFSGSGSGLTGTAGSLTAGNANQLIGKNWYWSGQGGQPSWLWGGTDGTNMYVYNPSNFSVNYATTAGALSSMNVSQFTNNSGYLANGATPTFATVNLNSTGALDYWGGGSAYRTWMDNSTTYRVGSVQDYAIHFTMDAEDSGRGFTWGALNATPSMSEDINGNLWVKTKITVPTVDPLYTINGTNYATYLPGMTGVNEETAGTLTLTKGADGTYSDTINFGTAAKGSDFWLFAQATNLKNTFSGLIVSLTPSFDGNVWYTKNAATDTLTIHGSATGEVSYNLTAPRFDAAQWTNLAPANESNSPGLIIND